MLVSNITCPGSFALILDTQTCEPVTANTSTALSGTLLWGQKEENSNNLSQAS
jgi:hypothetical protein